MILFVIFTAISFALIPFAWIIGIFDKLNVTNTNYTIMDKIANYMFIPFGPLILVLDVFSDLIYFWKNNFRTDLKQNIIVKDDSELIHESLRDMESHISKMGTNKIKSLNTGYLIKHFRSKLQVSQNIQFLLFGQWIPKNGFQTDGSHIMNAMTQFKSMKTQDLEEARIEEKVRLDDSIQFIKSKADLIQYNEIKKILQNLTFRDKEKKILCSDIIWDVLDETR